jgi:membrane protein implicated in regulation of membrane protease activity
MAIPYPPCRGTPTYRSDLYRQCGILSAVADPSMLALPILLLVFLAAIVAALLLALGFEQRSKLSAMHAEQRRNARRVEERLSEERACMLRDIAKGEKKVHEDDDSA